MPVEIPISCPICLDTTIERLEGIVLAARTRDGNEVAGVSVYHCSHWHLFALFNQPVDW
jgi:hypothetical protein